MKKSDSGFLIFVLRVKSCHVSARLSEDSVVSGEVFLKSANKKKKGKKGSSRS